MKTNQTNEISPKELVFNAKENCIYMKLSFPAIHWSQVVLRLKIHLCILFFTLYQCTL